MGAILFTQHNSLSNFGRGLPKEHSCGIILESINWFSRRSCLKFLFLALAAILFKGVELSEQFCWRVIHGKFLYDYFKIHPLVKTEKLFKGFSIFSSGGHFVQRSGTV